MQISPDAIMINKNTDARANSGETFRGRVVYEDGERYEDR